MTKPRRALIFVCLLLGAACDSNTAEEVTTADLTGVPGLDPGGAYGNCEASCASWSWDLEQGIGCICTPACDTVSDCPDPGNDLPLTCQPQDDPDPGRCIFDCESDTDCPDGLECQPVAGCMWPR